MKVRFNRWYNAVLTALLGLLGFESCDSEGGGMEEYGCPYANYIVKGVVTDEAGMPIKGIKVKAPYGSEMDSQYGQIVQTDTQGSFVLHEFTSLRGNDIIFEDIDGEDNNGLFQSDTIYVESLPKTQLEKGSRWYQGKYEVTADIKLKRK